MTVITKLILTTIIKHTISTVKTYIINHSSISRIFSMDRLLEFISVSLGFRPGELPVGVIRLLLPCVRVLSSEIQTANIYWACITFKVF